MLEFVIELSIPIIVATIAMLLIGGLVWLIGGYGLDKLRHSGEWASKGQAGEGSAFATIYRYICDQLKLLERPDEPFRKAHVERLRRNKAK